MFVNETNEAANYSTFRKKEYPNEEDASQK